MKRIYFVDCETYITEVELAKDDLCYYFVGNSGRIRKSSENVFVVDYKLSNFHDSLDNIINAFVGFMLNKYGYSVECIIKSGNIMGFANTQNFWNELGYQVFVDDIGNKESVERPIDTYIRLYSTEKSRSGQIDLAHKIFDLMSASRRLKLLNALNNPKSLKTFRKGKVGSSSEYQVVLDCVQRNGMRGVII